MPSGRHRLFASTSDSVPAFPFPVPSAGVFLNCKVIVEGLDPQFPVRDRTHSATCAGPLKFSPLTSKMQAIFAFLDWHMLCCRLDGGVWL